LNANLLFAKKKYKNPNGWHFYCFTFLQFANISAGTNMKLNSVTLQQCPPTHGDHWKPRINSDKLDLLTRARRVLESAAAASLVLVPLALQPAAAATLDTGDLIVDQSGPYFYNSSGYFAYWNSQPDGGGQSTVNVDGSTKLFGSASASPGQFLAHNTSSYSDRGVALVWSGTLARPAALGDRLAINVDFNITIPDTGGEWSFGAQLANYNIGDSNSLSTWGGGITSSWQSEAGTYRVHGLVLTDPLDEYQMQSDTGTFFWKVYVTGTAGTPYSEGGWSDTYERYMTPYRGISITVPEYSIDVSHVDANYVPSGNLGLTVTAVPEPSEWLLMLLGIGLLGARTRRRN
jgi:hypothetical protein